VFVPSTSTAAAFVQFVTVPRELLTVRETGNRPKSYYLVLGIDYTVGTEE
jgi:hypothetical protein